MPKPLDARFKLNDNLRPHLDDLVKNVADALSRTNYAPSKADRVTKLLEDHAVMAPSSVSSEVAEYMQLLEADRMSSCDHRTGLISEPRVKPPLPQRFEVWVNKRISTDRIVITQDAVVTAAGTYVIFKDLGTGEILQTTVDMLVRECVRVQPRHERMRVGQVWEMLFGRGYNAGYGDQLVRVRVREVVRGARAQDFAVLDFESSQGACSVSIPLTAVGLPNLGANAYLSFLGSGVGFLSGVDMAVGPDQTAYVTAKRDAGGELTIQEQRLDPPPTTERMKRELLANCPKHLDPRGWAAACATFVDFYKLRSVHEATMEIGEAIARFEDRAKEPASEIMSYGNMMRTGVAYWRALMPSKPVDGAWHFRYRRR